MATIAVLNEPIECLSAYVGVNDGDRDSVGFV